MSTTASPPSPPPTNRVTATFVDRDVEAAFQREHMEIDVRPYTRFSLIVASVCFMSYGVNDAFFLLGPLRDRAWFARYVLFTPVALAVIAFTYAPAYARLHQRAVLVFGLAMNAVVLWIAAIALATDPAAFFVYTSYAVLFVTLGPFIAKMNVAMQCVYTVLTVLVFVGFAAAIAHPTAVVTASTVMTFLSLGGIGALVSRQGELQSRQLFVQRQLIAAQMVELDLERAKSEGLLLNILPRSIADRLKSSATSIADGFPAVTVLFADMVGFTKLSSRLSPVELVGGLNEMFSAFDDLAEQHGVEKIKTIGDAYMAVAGLHGETDHAARLADMALGMVERVTAMNRFAEPLSVRVGLHSGPAVAGVIGKKKFIYDVWGDTVNIASRMESHAEPGKVQVTEETKALLEKDFELEPRGEIEVKGKGKMRTWFLLRRRR
jgi:class 3 adenylate cyclase